jgi:hypothetical protein
MSVLPHPSWCSPRWCTATDTDAEGTHLSRPTVVNGGGRIPVKLEVQIERVDSGEYGHPWICLRDLRNGTLVMLKIADTRRLVELLTAAADEAERGELGGAA